jgi:hypothetical protein
MSDERTISAAEEMTCIGRSRSAGWVEAYAVEVLTASGLGGPPQLKRSNSLRWTSMVTELEEVPMSIVLRHEALLVRMGVEDRHRSAVVAVG